MGPTSTQDSIVTGGGSGMGRAIAIRLAAHGVVGVLDRDTAGAAETVRMISHAGGRAKALTADVTNPASLQAAFDLFTADGHVPQSVIACAGIERLGTVIDEPVENWDLVMDVNAKGVYLTARSAYRGFVERGRGSFIVIASDAGIVGANNFGVYCASKFSTIGLIKCLALDFGHLGIRANAVCPSTVKTPMLESALLEYPGSDKYWSSTVPLGRLAEPEEIASIVEFLASPDAQYINGQTYTVDGGATTGIYPSLQQV